MNYTKFARRGMGVVLLTLIVLFLFSCSLLAGAFSVISTPDFTQQYESKDFLLDGVDYYNIKSPSGILAEDFLVEDSNVLFTFIADESSGCIFVFSAKGDFIIDTPLKSPSRLRAFENRYLLVLDKGQVHIFDIATKEGGKPYSYLGKITFQNAQEFEIKDFIIKPFLNTTQLYFIDVNNSLYQLSMSKTTFRCDNIEFNSKITLNLATETPIALNFWDNWVYVLCSRSYIRFQVSNAQERIPLSLDNPRDIAIVNANGNDADFVLIADRNGIIARVYGTDKINNNRDGKTTGIKSGEFIAVNAMSLKGNQLFISDSSAHAKCVQRFLVGASGTLTYDNFFIGSKGADTGRLYEPSAVAVFDKKTFIADTNNKRIQIWDNESKMPLSTIDLSSVTVDNVQKDFTPLGLTVTEYNGNTHIFVTTASNNVLLMDEDGNVLKSFEGAGSTKFRSIASITSNKHYVFVMDTLEKKVFKLPLNNLIGGVFSVIVSGLTAPVTFDVGVDQKIYVSDLTEVPIIRIFSESGIEQNTITFPSSIASITAILVDDRETIYYFADNNQFSQLNSLMVDSASKKYLHTVFTHEQKEFENIKSVAICGQTGDFFVTDTNGSLIKIIDKSELGIFISDEAPVGLEPPIFIKNENLSPDSFHPIDFLHEATSSHDYAEADEVRIAKVIKTGTFVFPIDIALKSNPLFPTGYSINDYPLPVRIDENVIVLTSDEFNSTNGFAYVLYRGLAGFIKAENLDISARDTINQPYKSINGFGLTLYNNVEVFKYPSLEKHTNGSYFYLLDTLTIDTQLTVICRVEDPIDNSYFYEIKYAADGSDPDDRDTWQTAFVRRYHVSPDSERNTPERTAGKIKADVNKGLVAVYEEPNGAISPDLALRDNTRVTVKSEIGDWVEVEWTTATGEIRRGFLEDKYIIYTGLTAMQVVGIIILILALATIVITVWLKKPKKQTQVQSEIMRF